MASFGLPATAGWQRRDHELIESHKIGTVFVHAGARVPALMCYRVAERIDGTPNTTFRDALDLDGRRVTEYGPIEGRNFTAHLLVVTTPPHDARWAGFLRSGFGDNLQLPRASSPAALLVIEARRRRRRHTFALPFGVAGRFLLAANGYERTYGLRAALNLIYRRGSTAVDPDRLRSIDSKRRGPTTVRSRMQASEAAAFEVFNVNQLRDVVSAATGIPVDQERWGRRVSGGDALHVDVDISFDELGDFCLRVEDAHARDDYKDNFDWIDYVHPVTEPSLRERLERAVLERLDNDGEGLELAPPEIVDWDRVSSFHYHYDRPQGRARSPVTHPDMRLAEYLRGLRHHHPDERLTVAHLRTRRIQAVDGGGDAVHNWSVWRCIVGELTLESGTYILDEGEFFTVRADYLTDLDTYIDGIPESLLALPATTPTTHERHYNEGVATNSADFVLLDRKTITVEHRTTPIEICDLVTEQRHLVHVKRHLGSSDLSHLFAQGFVSAELLQMNPAFRRRAHEQLVAASEGRSGFDFFDTAALNTRDFHIVYAIAADWSGRSMAQALPFFSKVNLRNVAEELRGRGYQVETHRIDAT